MGGKVDGRDCLLKLQRAEDFVQLVNFKITQLWYKMGQEVRKEGAVGQTSSDVKAAALRQPCSASPLHPTSAAPPTCGAHSRQHGILGFLPQYWQADCLRHCQSLMLRGWRPTRWR